MADRQRPTDPYCSKPDPEDAGYECENWKAHTGPHTALVGWPMAPIVELHWYRGQVWLTRGGVEIEGTKHCAEKGWSPPSNPSAETADAGSSKARSSEEANNAR